MKTILMLCPFFVPYAHAKVYRPYRLVKFLPRFGWAPVVVMANEKFNYFEDPSLLEDLPPEAQIIRTRYIEAGWRGLMDLVGLKPFSYTQERARLITERSQALPHAPRRTWFDRLSQWRDDWFMIPDRMITWHPAAYRAAVQVVRRRRIDAIYSSHPLPSVHLLARRLQRRLGVPWIAEFRDPWTEHPMHQQSYYLPWRRAIETRMEAKMLREADAVVTATDQVRTGLIRQYPWLQQRPVTNIPTGVDVEKFAQASAMAHDQFWVVFIGEFLRADSLRFFQLLKTLLEQGRISRQQIRVKIIGNLHINIILQRHLDALALSDVVELVDYLPERQCFSLVKSADANLLVLPANYGWCLPMKLSIYLQARKPIIALVPEGAAAQVLRGCGFGALMPADDAVALEVLAQILQRTWQGGVVDETLLDTFSATQMTRQFAAVLDDAVRSASH
ncbi:MAG: glycosyltransferase [Candidatus Omnitrophica bacterium]|nr:glycosyltransferase [Candidatus Omnitrophota bacterium]